jgi:hypothetical protein
MSSSSIMSSDDIESFSQSSDHVYPGTGAVGEAIRTLPSVHVMGVVRGMRGKGVREQDGKVEM